ncbi:hypothetical protein V6N13_003093 [Hibiscus sabdariffa]
MDCVDPDVRKRPKMGHVIRTLEADDLFFHDERRIAREHSEVDRQADEMSLYDSSQLKKSSYHMWPKWALGVQQSGQPASTSLHGGPATCFVRNFQIPFPVLSQ